jgi:hypothetical protein
MQEITHPGKVVSEADRAGEHHLGPEPRMNMPMSQGLSLVDPTSAVEPQHLPGRRGGDHDIAVVADRGDQTRKSG